MRLPTRMSTADRIDPATMAGRSGKKGLVGLLTTCLFFCMLVESRSETWSLSEAQRNRARDVLLAGMRSGEFWPSMHAAEGLTLAGWNGHVLEELPERLQQEMDDQKRCGLARELVRAGDRRYLQVLFGILASEDPHGHVHAAESLFKMREIGDGIRLRAAMAQSENVRLRLMAAAALARCGNPLALKMLRETVHAEDDSIARLAVWVLGRIGDATDQALIRRRRETVSVEIDRCFFDHSLAALGDPAGQRRLLENLQSPDAAVRTYAATFAGDARLLSSRERLLDQLEDPALDARIRAAQTLLQLERASDRDPEEDISRIVFQATSSNPRYTEGSIIPRWDGSLEFAVTEFAGKGSDFDAARIISRRSADDGRSWSSPRVLQQNTGGQNVMSVTLRRFVKPADPDHVAMFFLEKNSFDDLDLYVRFSEDELDSFGDRQLVTDLPGYHVVNNDRVLQLTTGRILVPAASTADVKTINHFRSRCFISDDGGRSWRPGRESVDLPKRGAMEPGLVELNDGRVLMILRNQLGYISRCVSEDGGETWSKPESLGLKAPEAPATIRRIPATGDLMILWNNTFQPGTGHGGARTPLTVAVSGDEGRHWSHVRDLETRSDRTFSYPSVTFSGSRVIMSYWESAPEFGGYSCRFRSLPLARLYDGAGLTQR